MQNILSKSIKIVDPHKIEDDERVMTKTNTERNFIHRILYQSEYTNAIADLYHLFSCIDHLLIPKICDLHFQYKDVHKNNIYSEKRCELRVINWFFNWWRVLWMFLSYQFGCRIYEVPNFIVVLGRKESDMRELLDRIGEDCTLDRNDGRQGAHVSSYDL